MSPEPRYTVVFPSLYLSSTPVTEKEGEFIALLHNSVVFYESSPDDGQLTPLRLESGVKCVSGAWFIAALGDDDGQRQGYSNCRALCRGK